MIILSNIPDRINEFMVLKGFTAKTLAEELGFTHTTVLNVLQARHLPSTPFLFAFIQRFQCSADYVLGLTENYSEDAKYLPPVTDFGTRFSQLLKSTGTSQYSLTKRHGISGNLIYKWLHNQNFPAPENLIKLSKAFNCSVDFILGRSDF